MLSHLISIVILSVVPLLWANSDVSEASSSDIQLGSLDGSLEGIRVDIKTSVREAVTLLSVSGGQGMLRCNCTYACANNHCSCRKNSLLCNSKCHGGNNNCTNK